MGLDDVVSTESAVVAGITAAVFSPRTRETMRRGAVYSVAGVLKVGDVVAGAARGATRGIKGEESVASDAASDGGEPAAERKTPARRSRSSSGRTSGGSRAS